MAAPKRRANSRRRRRNPTRVTVYSRRRNRKANTHRRRSSGRRRNPNLFGQHVTPVAMGKAVLGGLVGVALAKLIPPRLPGSLTSSAPMRILVTGVVAFATGMLANKYEANFGAAVLFGGLMQTASVALNTFNVGLPIGLAGGRGMGDIYPGYYPMPQNPMTSLPPAAAMPMAARPVGVNGAFGSSFGRSF